MNTVYPSTESKIIKAEQLAPGQLWWHSDSHKRMFVRCVEGSELMKKTAEVPADVIVSFEPATGAFVLTKKSANVYVASDFTVMASNA